MRITPRSLLALTLTAVLASACARDIGGATYSSSNTVGKVIYGTVISARQVTVKDNDKLEGNGLGGIAGGVVGGIAGSGVGGGSGRGVATAGGAIAGAVLGAAIQDQLGTSSGTEYIVQLDRAQKTGRVNDVSKNRYDINRGNSVREDINESIAVAGTESEAIAVVQRDDAPIAVGSRVVIVYSDDRPRVVPLR